MGSLADDYDLLLTAPNPVEAALAKDLLTERGIPSFTHGRDRDLAELGSGVHNALTRPDVYVPKGMRERAQAILAEAWTAEPLPAEGAPDAELEPEPPEPFDPAWSSSAPASAASAGRPGRPWVAVVLAELVLAVVLVVVFVVLWAFARA